MKLSITYTDGVRTLGTDTFDIANPTWQDEMQKRGRAVSAKFARTRDGRQSYNIKYDDKHSEGLTASDED